MVFIAMAHGPAAAQLGYGPEAGIGVANMLFKPENVFTSFTTSATISARLGGTIDIGFTQHIYFQSGLFFSHKGQKRTYSFYVNDSFSDAEQQTLNLYYIDLPLSVVFKTGLQGKGRFFFGLGATLSYLAWGKNIREATGVAAGVPFNVADNGSVNSATLRAFDLGGNFFAGYELSTGWYFKAHIMPGVKDLGLGSEIDKNRVWGLAAGYFFGKGRNINREANDLIDKTGD